MPDDDDDGLEQRGCARPAGEWPRRLCRRGEGVRAPLGPLARGDAHAVGAAGIDLVGAAVANAGAARGAAAGAHAFAAADGIDAADACTTARRRRTAALGIGAAHHVLVLAAAFFAAAFFAAAFLAAALVAAAFLAAAARLVVAARGLAATARLRRVVAAAARLVVAALRIALARLVAAARV